MMFKARFKVAESPDVFCAELSSLMALFGLGAMSDLSPLSGVKRKLDFGAVRAAFDPGCVKTFFLPQKQPATGDDPRRHDGLSIFLLDRVRSQPGRKLGPR